MSENRTLDNFGDFEDQFDAYAQEAGISELQELYDRIEGTYARAAIAVAQAETAQISDSTNAMTNYADLGPDTPRT